MNDVIMQELIHTYATLVALVAADVAAEGGRVTAHGFALRGAAISVEAEIILNGGAFEAGIIFRQSDSAWD